MSQSEYAHVASPPESIECSTYIAIGSTIVLTGSMHKAVDRSLQIVRFWLGCRDCLQVGDEFLIF